MVVRIRVWILAVGVLTASGPIVLARDPQFPASGTPYPQAKEMLLRQGLFIGPAKVEHPDRRFPEVNCWGIGQQRTCQAAFVQTQPDGWGWYVIVGLNPADLRVSYADFAKTADGFPAIPPPPPPDVPKLNGRYYPEGRVKLQKLGYKPIPTVGKPSSICTQKCERTVVLAEATCSGTGAAFCSTFWLAPDGRILRVDTIGEDAPTVYYIKWSSREEQRNMTAP